MVTGEKRKAGPIVSPWTRSSRQRITENLLYGKKNVRFKGEKITVREVKLEESIEAIKTLGDDLALPLEFRVLEHDHRSLSSIATSSLAILKRRLVGMNCECIDASNMAFSEFKDLCSCQASEMDPALIWLSPAHMTNKSLIEWVLELTRRPKHGPLMIRKLIKCAVFVRGHTVGVFDMYAFDDKRFQALATLSCCICQNDVGSKEAPGASFFRTGGGNIMGNTGFQTHQAVQCCSCSSMYCTSCFFKLSTCSICRNLCTGAEVYTIPKKKLTEPHLSLGIFKSCQYHYGETCDEFGINDGSSYKKLYRRPTNSEIDSLGLLDEGDNEEDAGAGPPYYSPTSPGHHQGGSGHNYYWDPSEFDYDNSRENPGPSRHDPVPVQADRVDHVPETPDDPPPVERVDRGESPDYNPRAPDAGPVRFPMHDEASVRFGPDKILQLVKFWINNLFTCYNCEIELYQCTSEIEYEMRNIVYEFREENRDPVIDTITTSIKTSYEIRKRNLNKSRETAHYVHQFLIHEIAEADYTCDSVRRFVHDRTRRYVNVFSEDEIDYIKKDAFTMVCHKMRMSGYMQFT